MGMTDQEKLEFMQLLNKMMTESYVEKMAEPRVITLEELLAFEENTPVYIECISGACGWDVFAGTDYDDSYEYVITGAPWAVKEYWRQSLYNVSWRCWTSESDEEQRESVEWD